MMKERKYVKFRVDMLSDTKSKIIDMKPERDLIHYVWMALVLLAGKVNLEGDLYMSKSIPYTVETLAIEFNRGTYQVKLAIDVLMELEMIELTENNVYRVKNFAKHQNIKVKDKKLSNYEVEVKENSINKADVNQGEVSLEVTVNEDEITENKTSKYKEENVKENIIGNLEIINNDINKISDNNLSKDKLNKPQGNMQVLLGTKKNNKLNKMKKKEVNIKSIDEDIGEDTDDYFHKGTVDVEEDKICYFHDGDGEISLGEGGRIVKAWSL